MVVMVMPVVMPMVMMPVVVPMVMMAMVVGMVMMPVMRTVMRAATVDAVISARARRPAARRPAGALCPTAAAAAAPLRTGVRQGLAH
jgi:hypothetical protein